MLVPTPSLAPSRASQRARQRARQRALPVASVSHTGPGQVDDQTTVRAIVDRTLADLFRTAVGARLALAPLLVAVAMAVAWVDPSPWRRGLMVSISVAAVGAAIITELRARRRGIDLSAIPLNILVMSAYQAAMIIGTGGLVSPLLPAMLPLAAVAAVMLGRRPATAAVITFQLLLLSVLAGLQALQLAPGLVLPVLHGVEPVHATGIVTAALAMVLLITAASLLGVFLRGRLEAMVADALTARQVQLDTWRAWSRDLELLGGEIAHELKNPLASIKGLSALIARQLSPGKEAERMAVLQGEVSRMQQVIDEFLTFSRPVTPLSVAPVQTRALCLRVAALHEGLALSAGVGLGVSGPDLQLLADGHKLLQVLTNLVQNALSAAPAGTSIELSVAAATAGGAAGVCVDVADRGAGVDPALRERIFQAGVTGRTDGSSLGTGLGLGIARGIAQQHGGRLTLVDRPGGGTVARLWLPLEPTA